jgi:hypothetical protein
VRNLPGRFSPQSLQTALVVLLLAAVATGCSVSGLGLTSDDTGDPAETGSGLAGATVDGGPTDTSDGVGAPSDEADGAMSEDVMSDGAMSEDVMSEDVMSEDVMSDGSDEMVDNSFAEEAAAEDRTTIDPAAIERQLSTDPNAEYRVGDCFMPRIPGAVPSKVACTEGHTIEIYGVRQLPGGAGTPFAGLDEAIRVCNEDFLAVTGVALDLASIFERSVLRPSEETWLAGERDVICYVVYPEPTVEPLNGLNPLRSFGRASLYGLRRGDCLIDFDDSSTSFTLANCDEPHDAEVFAETTINGTEYPGDDAISAQADELCFGQGFEDFVGTPHATSTIRALRSKPTSETWALGFRTITCLLTDGLVRTGSFRGSEL